MNKFAQTQEIIRSIRKQTDTAVLFYSAGGKDGIALLDMLSREFTHVICYFMYLVEDLEHTNIYIRWAEKRYPNVEVRSIPHWTRTFIKKNGFFCDPVDDIKVLKIADIEKQVFQETNIPFAFNGMKGVDGYMKRMRLKMYAPMFTTPKGMVYPLALWTNKEVLKYIQTRNLIQPMNYGGLKSVSQCVGVELESLLYLKKNFPNDYRKLLKEFPYAEKVVFDYESKQSKTTRIP